MNNAVNLAKVNSFDYVMKLMLIGDSGNILTDNGMIRFANNHILAGVGKSSLLLRFTDASFGEKVCC
jgi:hypothetical protein